MATITKISLQAKNKDRVSVYTDGKFFCGLDVFTLEKFGLKEGAEIDESRLSEIQRDAQGSEGFEKAIKYIMIRRRSENEIRVYLKGKEFANAVIDGIVEKLKEYNYIDDSAFVECYIEAHKKDWGIKRIKFELKKFKVDENIIEEAFEDFDGQSGEAYVLAEKYNRTQKAFDKRKIFAYLYNKGFNGDCIKSAVNRLEEELKNNEEDDG